MIQTESILSVLHTALDKDLSQFPWYKPMQRLMALESYASHILDIFPYHLCWLNVDKAKDREYWLGVIAKEEYPALMKDIKKYRRSVLTECLLAYLLLKGDKDISLGIGYKGEHRTVVLIAENIVYSRSQVELDRVEKKPLRSVFEEAYLLSGKIPTYSDTAIEDIVDMFNDDLVQLATFNHHCMNMCQSRLVERIWEQIKQCVPSKLVA